MVSLITRCEPRTPPRTAVVRIQPRKGEPSKTSWNHHSYGAMLLKEPDDEKWDYVDEELRETLVKCLARDPDHRPDLQYLLDQALEKCQEEGEYVYAEGEVPATDQYALTWMAGVLNNATPGQYQGP
ncbi:hypothetical protein BKA67DRAFT_569149 [Truncatella angustata]|uniref:Protein kinase domain-containing protein n=1 Tax=Truncatella angustata TaxID=152316 RepID=A0A9P8ZW63_9PEZI|nr:uncharacterized protein BKA67DRAFT_569149 [Truncatella angustata]KAH6653310.1 hypothetical protein BKA67DRAFT_569149 [Truncatella angustata]